MTIQLCNHFVKRMDLVFMCTREKQRRINSPYAYAMFKKRQKHYNIHNTPSLFLHECHLAKDQKDFFLAYNSSLR